MERTLDYGQLWKLKDSYQDGVLLARQEESSDGLLYHVRVVSLDLNSDSQIDHLVCTEQAFHASVRIIERDFHPTRAELAEFSRTSARDRELWVAADARSKFVYNLPISRVVEELRERLVVVDHGTAKLKQVRRKDVWTLAASSTVHVLIEDIDLARDQISATLVESDHPHQRNDRRFTFQASGLNKLLRNYCCVWNGEFLPSTVTWFGERNPNPSKILVPNLSYKRIDSLNWSSELRFMKHCVRQSDKNVAMVQRDIGEDGKGDRQQEEEQELALKPKSRRSTCLTAAQRAALSHVPLDLPSDVRTGLVEQRCREAEAQLKRLAEAKAKQDEEEFLRKSENARLRLSREQSKQATVSTHDKKHKKRIRRKKRFAETKEREPNLLVHAVPPRDRKIVRSSRNSIDERSRAPMPSWDNLRLKTLKKGGGMTPLFGLELSRDISPEPPIPRTVCAGHGGPDVSQ